MKSIQVSVFKGFSKPTGNISLLEKLADIAEGKHLSTIKKLRTLLSEGKEEEAVRVKRQLPGFTISATYTEKRREEGMTGYNDILILDFDKLAEEELLRCREVIIQMPYTLFCFRSPSGNGLKAGVYYKTGEVEELRSRLFAKTEISITELETYHKNVFDQCRRHYETHCLAEVDTSGSDIGRLCFVSYDPDIYINHQGIEALTPPQTAITVPPAAENKGRKSSQQEMIRKELPGNPSVDFSHINPHVQMEFQRCINKVQRDATYQPGQRDRYIYTLGHVAYCQGLPEEYTAVLAQHRYGGDPDINIRQIIANAYQYTSKTDRQKEEKQKLTAVRLMEFLGSVCEARRNIILDILEIRMKTGSLPDTTYHAIRRKDYNTLYIDSQFAGIPSQPHIVKTVIDSRFALDFNPFDEYFYGLPAWDKETDYIGKLAETMKTNNQDFWLDCFKRWIVGLVACALDDERENQLALIIKGAQGKGKSSWIRRLLPPELKRYYRNGMLNPSNRDHMLLLSKCLIINLEEFEGMKKEDISELKRLISQDSITERKVYAEQDDLYIRRASFIASTNEPRFLEDITGTRRFPTVTAEEIDYKTPFDHANVYAQALYLWKSGFKYWYDEEEFQALNAHNAQYVIASQEQELFYAYFRKPLTGDHSIKWMSASTILGLLATWGRIQSNKQSQRNLIRVLENGNFRKQITANDNIEYEVVYILETK